MYQYSVIVVLAIVGAVASNAVDIAENQIADSRAIRTGEELVSSVVDECFQGDVEYMPCVRSKVLVFLDSVVPKGRATAEDVDQEIMERVVRYLKGHEFRMELPEFLFQKARLTFRPAKGLSNFKVTFPKEEKMGRALTKARGHLKKKLLLPIILVLKLVMKALQPLFMIIIGMKATKALVLSKIAIGVVLGFVIMQVMNMKKMMMPMMPEIAPPMPYGPPPPPSPPTPYGAPSPAPPSSYEPGWEPSPPASSAGNTGPYSRVWDPHHVAYSAYNNPQHLSAVQTSTQKLQQSSN